MLLIFDLLPAVALEDYGLESVRLWNFLKGVIIKYVFGQKSIYFLKGKYFFSPKGNQ